ncbi:acyl-CoA dehydrogenase family protein [Pseudalkalibacillus berkeleyi]|uniref:Acyl-CoA dehydrogenase family protein n=1 Tax=Pseudalkalibacillus berkeleyi TaxID=1069813 RepID=A0ABS9H3H9_9BACL|nr:acyl-CoA dehydrogenase family protein [Pseudalkalibacillus berkeleyi]MCF6138464.1 acyl-CoA dehydrogenase family protein [Pseudalkalibacillus berkeleyi]
MNFFLEDPNFRFVLDYYLDDTLKDWAYKELEQFGGHCGSEIDERAVHTDREGQPKLIKFDRHGNDISHIWLNEGYKKTVEQVYNKGIVGYIHKEIPELNQKGNYIYSYAQGYLLSQTEAGFYCPVTLTMATSYLIDHYADEELKKKFLPHVLSTGETELYEGATFLTERQGGSDVGANETIAVKEGDHYRLTGEKYFASNAGACGVATVLARIEGAPSGTKGLSLFLVPWKQEDGVLNHIKIRRLKDKLGVRAVPSAEVEFEGAKAYLIGKADQGFHYMMEALNLSRVCNAVASVGIMRRATHESKKYAFQRDAFGKKLANYPMIKETLVNMTVRQEVQLGGLFRLIALFDQVMGKNGAKVTDEEKILHRLLIALVKMRTAEEAVQFSHEAIEMHGGNGYIEDFVTPRLLRDAQVLTVWEGTANILGLEVLRLLNKYNGELIFRSHMDELIGTLPNHVEPYVQPVMNGLEKLDEYIHLLKKYSPEMQTYYAKPIANLMADIYLCVSALLEAKLGGERKILIARQFSKLIWNHEKVDKDVLPVQFFDVFMNPATRSSESQKSK